LKPTPKLADMLKNGFSELRIRLFGHVQHL
jgi:hypothetical protein